MGLLGIIKGMLSGDDGVREGSEAYKQATMAKRNLSKEDEARLDELMKLRKEESKRGGLGW